MKHRRMKNKVLTPMYQETMLKQDFKHEQSKSLANMTRYINGGH